MTLSVGLGTIITAKSHETVSAAFSTPLHIYLNHSVFQETKPSHNIWSAKITSTVNGKYFNLTTALRFKGNSNLLCDRIHSPKSSKWVKQKGILFKAQSVEKLLCRLINILLLRLQARCCFFRTGKGQWQSKATFDRVLLHLRRCKTRVCQAGFYKKWLLMSRRTKTLALDSRSAWRILLMKRTHVLKLAYGLFIFGALKSLRAPEGDTRPNGRCCGADQLRGGSKRCFARAALSLSCVLAISWKLHRPRLLKQQEERGSWSFPWLCGEAPWRHACWNHTYGDTARHRKKKSFSYSLVFLPHSSLFPLSRPSPARNPHCCMSPFYSFHIRSPLPSFGCLICDRLSPVVSWFRV